MQTAEGKRCLYVAIDRTSKFAFVKVVRKTGRSSASSFLVALIEAVPYRTHTVLTDNGIQFTVPPRYADRAHRPIHHPHVRHPLSQYGIEHHLIEVRHTQWINRRVERKNRTIKEATGKRFHYVKAALVAKRRANRGALPDHLPRIETVVDIESASARAARAHCIVLARDVAERLDIVRRSSACSRCAGRNMAKGSSEDVVGQGACASAGDRGWHPDRGNGRPRDGLQVCQSPAALSPGPDLSPSGVRARLLHVGRLAGGRAAFPLRPVDERMLAVMKASQSC